MSYTHAYDIDPEVLNLDTTPLQSHPFKTRNKSKMVAVKRPPAHPLQQNGLMNFWGTVLPAFHRGPPPLAMPFAESVVFRDNQTVGWYRWDAAARRPICRAHFPVRVPKRAVAEDDRSPTEELDWDAEEESEPSEAEDAPPEEDLEDDLEDDEYRDEEGSEPEEPEFAAGDASPHHRQMANLYKRFTLPPACEEPGFPVAVFVADETGDVVEAREGSGARQVSVEHFDAAGLRHFLAGPKRNGVLQRYIPPPQGHHTVVQAVWTPYVVVVERRQNQHLVWDTERPLLQRTVTSAAVGTLTREVPIAAALSEEVERYFAHLGRWLHSQQDAPMVLCRAVAYFTLDDCERPHLLWMSAMELMPALEPHPQLSHNLRAQAMHVHYLTRNMAPTTLIGTTAPTAPARKRSPARPASAPRDECHSPPTHDPFAHSQRCASCRASPDLTASFRQWLALSGDHLPADMLPMICNRLEPHTGPPRKPTPEDAPEGPPRFVTPYDRERQQTYRQYRRRQHDMDEKRLRAIDQRVALALEKQAKAEDALHRVERAKAAPRPLSHDPLTGDGRPAADGAPPPAPAPAPARQGTGSAPVSAQRRRHHLPALAQTHPPAPAAPPAPPRAKTPSPTRDALRRERRLRRREQGWDGCVRLGRQPAPRPPPQDLFDLYRRSHVQQPHNPLTWHSHTTKASESCSSDGGGSNEPPLDGTRPAEGADGSPRSAGGGAEDREPTARDVMAQVLLLQRVYRGFRVRRRLRLEREAAEREAAAEAKRREAAARAMQRWWHRMSELWRARRAAASPSKLRGHLTGARYEPRSRLFGEAYSERQRRRMGRRGYKTALDMLFARPPTPRKRPSSQPSPTTAGHGTPSSHWRKTPGAPGTMTMRVSTGGDFTSPSAGSYVAIEARYNNRIALDFVEDMFYEAYSHQLNRKGGLFRFALPPELGLLRVEIDAMLLGFGAERDPRTPEQIAAEEAALLAAKTQEAKATLRTPNAALLRGVGGKGGSPGSVTGPGSRRSSAVPPAAAPDTGRASERSTTESVATAKEKPTPETELFGLDDDEAEEDEEEEEEDFEDDFEEAAPAKEMSPAMSLRKIPAPQVTVAPPQQTADREKTLQFRYQLRLNKGTLVQLHKEMEGFRDFATKTFSEDATLVDRIKDGVESGKLTYYEVIMQVKREREAQQEGSPRGFAHRVGSSNHLDDDDS